MAWRNISDQDILVLDGEKEPITQGTKLARVPACRRAACSQINHGSSRAGGWATKEGGSRAVGGREQGGGRKRGGEGGGGAGRR